MEITAVIPVRKGSKRVKNKNIRPFAGSSLLENKIKQLKRVKQIDEIVVSSDSDEMLDIARENGVTAIKRPYEYCDEISRNFNEVVRYIATQEIQTDVMMWVPCVCPLITERKIEEGIRLFDKMQSREINADSIVTATLIKEYLFDENGPVNFNIEHHVPSQKLPDWHYIINGFFIARRKDMAKWGFVYGPHPYLYEVNKYEAIDIDDEYDFMWAEFLMKLINKED